MNLEFKSSNAPSTNSSDALASWFEFAAHGIIMVVVGLLPLLFIPSIIFPLEYTKTAVVVSALLVAILLFSLSVLRTGSLSVGIPTPVYALWGVVLVAMFSGLLSGDRFGALVGTSMEVQTVAFITVLVALVTIPLVINFSKGMIVKTYTLLGFSALLLSVYHIVKILLGSEALSFGVFGDPTSSPFGSWNSLGIFFGLTVILSLIAIEQLPLTKWGRIFFGLITVLSLVMLVVINFFAVWIVLGLVGLVVLIYGLTKDRFSEETLIGLKKKSPTSPVSLALAGMVCAVAMLALLGGTGLSAMVSSLTNISFLEVRPSVGSSFDIAKSVYQEDAFLGIGPNKFSSAWRLHKDTSINQTLFWSVDFVSGYSYLITSMITLGILGVIAWASFFILFILSGMRMLLRPQVTDVFWYFVGSSSFAASLYLWGMAAVYTPNSTILLLAAFFTSMTCVAYVSLNPSSIFSLSLAKNKRATFLLVGVVVVVMILSVNVLHGVSRHYFALVTFNDAIRLSLQGAAAEQVDTQILRAFEMSPNDLFMRQYAEIKLGMTNVMLGTITNPTQTQQDEFLATIGDGLFAAQRAVAEDATDPRNWLISGALYSVLSGIGVEGAKDRSVEAYQNARELDPKNPLYHLLEAQLATRVNDPEMVRTSLNQAIALKPNYTEALLYLADFEISQGNVADAANSVRSVLSIEPNNPARYFQLATLLIADGDSNGAVVALERAVQLDPNYANARFVLARLYADRGDRNAALSMLRVVADLNPENEEVRLLTERIERGEDVGFAETPSSEVALPDISGDADVVTAVEDPDTSLVTPVNIGGSTNEAVQQSQEVSSPSLEQQGEVMIEESESEAAPSSDQ